MQHTARHSPDRPTQGSPIACKPTHLTNISVLNLSPYADKPTSKNLRSRVYKTNFLPHSLTKFFTYFSCIFLCIFWNFTYILKFYRYTYSYTYKPTKKSYLKLDTLILLIFRAPLIFTHHKYAKVNSARNRLFFVHLGARKLMVREFLKYYFRP